MVCLLSCSDQKFRRTIQIDLKDEDKFNEFVDSLVKANSTFDTINWIYQHPVKIIEEEEILSEDDIQVPQTFKKDPFIYSRLDYSTYSFSTKYLDIEILETDLDQDKLDSLFYFTAKNKGSGILVSLPYSWSDSKEKIWVNYKILRYDYCSYPSLIPIEYK
ncbi:hypothetical protein BC781_1156 [Sediminitomix flava]|uniref:Uncharacterized protein n=1 Tax=Sediminitomix flava TaxID=379075 RepID=A0A315YV06_SEDFL|nr:hypothetical protein BC781_1156 [Sediminitomix flava]